MLPNLAPTIAALFSRFDSVFAVPFRAAVVGLFLALNSLSSLHAAVFNCPSGDVPCLINGINAANATGKPDTIKLAAGVYTLATVNNLTDGANGLPSVTTKIKIKGKGPDQTIIRRDPSLGVFDSLRIIHVGVTGNLTLDGVAIRGGSSFDDINQGATGVFNRGTVNLANTIVSENFAAFGSAGIQNVGVMSLVESVVTDNFGGNGAAAGGIVNSGIMRISRSTIAGNCGETSGGIANLGALEIMDSAVLRNTAGVPVGGGGAIGNYATMTITNSTIVENGVPCSIPLPFLAASEPPLVLGGRGLYNIGGTVTVRSSTIARNVPDPVGFATGGIFSAAGGTVELQNTIVASNGNVDLPGDCHTNDGVIISLGNNLIGNTTRCDISLLASDLTGDPRLGAFIDDGTPGNGHIPLIVDSQAIDSGDNESCPKRDQIGNKRRKPCDIGAIEFKKND